MTRAAPIMPPAPPTFSTITVAPKFSPRRGPMIRPRISLPLPAANGTTMVTGRTGQSSATAGAVAATIATNAAIILTPCMVPPISLKNSVRRDVGRLDDRPPFLDLGLLVGAERFGGLLVAWRNLLAQIGELLPHFRIRQRLHDRG